MPEDEIKDIQVDLTMVGGRIVYDAAEREVPGPGSRIAGQPEAWTRDP